MVVDLVPSTLCIPSVALYSFLVTNIGGNASVLVPPLRKLIERGSSPHLFVIDAASNITTSGLVPVVSYELLREGRYFLLFALSRQRADRALVVCYYISFAFANIMYL